MVKSTPKPRGLLVMVPVSNFHNNTKGLRAEAAHESS